MVYDPTDQKIRKPRQFRGTPLQKYVRITALSGALLYCATMLYTLKKHVLPYTEFNEEFINDTDDYVEMIRDYVRKPIIRDTNAKIIERREAAILVKDKAENIQADK